MGNQGADLSSCLECDLHSEDQSQTEALVPSHKYVVEMCGGDKCTARECLRKEIEKSLLGTSPRSLRHNTFCLEAGVRTRSPLSPKLCLAT